MVAANLNYFTPEPLIMKVKCEKVGRVCGASHCGGRGFGDQNFFADTTEEGKFGLRMPRFH